MFVELLYDRPEARVGRWAGDFEGEVCQGRVVVRGKGGTGDDAEGSAAAATESPEEILILVGVCGYAGSLVVLVRREKTGW